MKTIYLAGPINGCTDHVANAWRDQVIDHLREERAPTGQLLRNAKALTLNPMRRDYRGVEATAVREIVQLDKRDINCSDMLLVRWLKPSVGTSMEIFYAWERDIPVIIWAEPGDDSDLSPWLVYHSTQIVRSFDDAMAAIERMIG
jgi:nucleoside 2-deoxyribosyltransferase